VVAIAPSLVLGLRRRVGALFRWCLCWSCDLLVLPCVGGLVVTNSLLA
jgi:hypothetical protein